MLQQSFQKHYDELHQDVNELSQRVEAIEKAQEQRAKQVDPSALAWEAA